MNEPLYVYFVFDDQLSSAAITDTLDWLATNSAVEDLSVTPSTAAPKQLDGADDGVKFNIGGIEYDLRFNASVFHLFEGVPLMELQVWGTHFQAQYAGASEARENTNRLIELVRDLYVELSDCEHEPRCVHGIPPATGVSIADGRVSMPQSQVAGETFDAVFWLHILSPPLVDTVGRERLLDTPAWRVEELPDRGILLVIDDAVDPVQGETDHTSEVMEHLNMSDEAYMP